MASTYFDGTHSMQKWWCFAMQLPVAMIPLEIPIYITRKGVLVWRHPCFGSTVNLESETVVICNGIFHFSFIQITQFGNMCDSIFDLLQKRRTTISCKFVIVTTVEHVAKASIPRYFSRACFQLFQYTVMISHGCIISSHSISPSVSHFDCFSLMFLQQDFLSFMYSRASNCYASHHLCRDM